MTQAAPRDTGGAPVLPYMMSPGPKPALGFFERNDEFQAQTRPALWTEEAQGYWVFTDHDNPRRTQPARHVLEPGDRPDYGDLARGQRQIKMNQ